MNQVMKSLFKETKFSVRENVLDCAHRIGPIYIDRVSQKSKKFLLQGLPPSTIEHYFTGWEKSQKYKSKAKSRFDLLNGVNNHVKDICAINLFYANVNFCLRVNFHDGKQENIFFSTFEKRCVISLIVKLKYTIKLQNFIIKLLNGLINRLDCLWKNDLN